MTQHNHFTRDIKPPGICPSCDEYHASQLDECCAPEGATEPECCSCEPGCDCQCVNCPCADDTDWFEEDGWPADEPAGPSPR